MLQVEAANFMVLLLNVFFFVPSTVLGLYGANVVLRMLGLMLRPPRS